jgi:hypothetical protein
MAHAFKTISAKPTFGTLRENLYQSDYINRKKGIITYCKYPSTVVCNKIRSGSSYNARNSFNTGRLALSLDTCNKWPVNKSNLIIGQYTKENLTNICTVSNIFPYSKPAPCSSDDPCNPCQNNDPVVINPASTTPFYQTYQIDPLGELFGQTQCGELNYTHYMFLYPPTKPVTLGNS